MCALSMHHLRTFSKIFIIKCIINPQYLKGRETCLTERAE